MTGGGTWCSIQPWSSSIICLNNGIDTIALHYHTGYPTTCMYSYDSTRVWVK
ncbi:MAG: hypothetical protein PHW52_05270 [Candidatus Pacebacteria bacterium]|nr:hypothetical protein [Candidatus Paceibacterota bacterium]